MAHPQVEQRLRWQSKAILLLVIPWTAVSVLLQGHWWATQAPVVAIETLSISAIFGLIVWKLRAATPGGAATGALITASLMFSTARYPYAASWYHSALIPLLLLFLLTWASTRAGRARKAALGTAEARHGRSASQVAANLGAAALVLTVGSILFGDDAGSSLPAFLALACLAEAAADTVSSELGQLLGRNPRSILTFRRVEPGTDGGVTLAGTLAGATAAFLVSASGLWAAHAERSIFPVALLAAVVTAAAVSGLLFDSVLGASLERKGWLNNDAVNFLSTLSALAAGFLILAHLVARIRL